MIIPDNTKTESSAIDSLTTEIAFLTKKNSQLTNEIAYLQEQLAWFKKQVFGKQSEKIISSDSQQLCFEGICDNLEEKSVEDTKEVKAHHRKKINRNGKDKITVPEDLPVKTVILDIPEEEKICKQTGISLVKIGEEITCKLAQTPSSFFIKKIIRPKYAVPHREESGVFIKDLPDFIMPKCRADESLLAEIVTKKFADHIPLYRLSEILLRERIGISRKLLSSWVVKLGQTLKPLHQLMQKKILSSNNVFIDETPVTSLEKNKWSTGYMWVMVGGEGPNPPYRIYDFRENRQHKHAHELLENYTGVIHSDKYGAYQVLAEQKKITWCPCWSHIRRKFVEAESGDPPFREWVLLQIQNLFTLEKEAWKLPPKERLLCRQKESIPIIDELIQKIKQRLVEGRILPKSKFKVALTYFYGLIPYLKNWTYYENARLDNNVAERAIRPLSVGRKNWLFFGSQKGGESASVLLSLVQTCRGLGINPRDYLEDIFCRYMGHPYSRLEELLPDQWLITQQSTMH